MACLRLVTFFPDRPDPSFPCFISRIVRSTLRPDFLEYLRPADFLRPPDFLRPDAVFRPGDFFRAGVFRVADFLRPVDFFERSFSCGWSSLQPWLLPIRRSVTAFVPLAEKCQTCELTP